VGDVRCRHGGLAYRLDVDSQPLTAGGLKKRMLLEGSGKQSLNWTPHDARNSVHKSETRLSAEYKPTPSAHVVVVRRRQHNGEPRKPRPASCAVPSTGMRAKAVDRDPANRKTIHVKNSERIARNQELFSRQ
jgi:hypothetical protein